MTPEDIKTATLEELQKAVTQMTSAKWELALEGKPQSTKTKADKTLLAAQKRRLSLENAELGKIEQKLIKNEKKLNAGKNSLDEALADLKNVQKVLDMVTDFIKIVDRILAVAASAAKGA